MKSTTNTTAWAERLTRTAVTQTRTSSRRCGGRRISDQRRASWPWPEAARKRALSGIRRRSTATTTSTGTAARYSSRQERPAGARMPPYRMADQPVPRAESMASQPKPKPLTAAGSSSATIVQTSTPSVHRKKRAASWQPTKIPMLGAAAVARVASV